MDPKEKAKELYLKYCPYDIMYCDPLGREIDGYYERYAKFCAITCVNEILKDEEIINHYAYWEKVKEELEKL